MKSPVYILGAGAIGGLIGHELKLTYPHNNIITLFKSLRGFNKYPNQKLRVNHIASDKIVSSSLSHVNGTTIESLKREHVTHIDNLIVSTKAYQTFGALAPYVDMINSDTNILFVQNGMGVINQCVSQYWSVLGKRPNIYKAVVTHGAYKTSPGVINHVGMGSMMISHIPQTTIGFLPENLEYPELIDMVTSTESLNGKTVNYHQFVLMEIEKLAVNACVNPLTAILDCTNGDLFRGSKTISIMKKVINELLPAVKAEYALILSVIPEANTVLEPKRLLNVVFDVINATRNNSSSMREDIRNLNRTEIDYINGFIVRLGSKHGVSTPVNRMLTQMIKTKSSMELSLDKSSVDLFVDQ